MLPNAIVYHGSNCRDGFASAWCFYKWLNTQEKCERKESGTEQKELNTEQKVLYLPASYSPNGSEAIKTLLNKKKIIMVDFCYTLELMKEIVESSVYTTVLDHHITSLPICEQLKNLYPEKFRYIHDLKRSGCQIAWDFCFNTPRPEFINYIADRDLWTFKLDNSKEINTAIFQYDIIFEQYDKLEQINVNDLYTQGKAIRDFIDHQVIPMFKNMACTKKIKIHDKVTQMSKVYQVSVVECPYIFRSDVGEALYQNPDIDFVMLWTYYLESNKYSISLRARKNSTDVSQVAQMFNGGGHVCASGFEYRGNLIDLFEPSHE